MSTALTPAQDQQLILNGYEPIPVAGKVPVVHGWQNLDIGLLPLQRKAYPKATGTGLRTKHLPSIDIDVRNPEHVKAFVALATEVLGETPLQRVGAKGVMLVYRTDAPFRKITVSTDEGDKIEVLADGQQFVAFGIHPDTHLAYTWVGCDAFGEKASPLTVDTSGVEGIDAGRARAFATRSVKLFEALGYSNPKVSVSAEVQTIERTIDVNEDQPHNISKAKQHLRNLIARGEILEGGRDTAIFKLAAHLRSEYFLSHDLIRELLLGDFARFCVPTFLDHEIIAPMVHAIGSPNSDATSYMQNEPGATASLPASQQFADALDKLPPELLREEPAGSTTDDGGAQVIILSDENFDVADAPVRASEYSSTKFPPLRELVPIWCERNTNTLLEGPAATQKSRAALQDAICLQAGLPVYGRKVEQCETLYMNYENSAEEMQRRVYLIRRYLQRDNKTSMPDVKGLHIWELRQKPRPILVVSRDGVVITRFGKRFLTLLATRRNMGLHTLVIFDGLMDAIVFKDNTRNDDAMALRLIQLIDSWCEEYDFTAQSIVHPSRSSERGGSVGSYATAWTTKPRAIQTFKRVLNPFGGHGTKAKITEDTPLADIYYQRRVQKRSNGPEGERVLLEYNKGGLIPHLPPQRAARTEEPPAPEVTDEPEDL